eukprot:CAMPEP_0118934272 /NCGR_PEP_ID=MMETSP1169-20130426/13733_1 /TAXON_ID=36882 /ORGANISM="Pyramimonas obovata, Strain CCMP722" /LENGTH=222 /DNA_ID=CAMNT_0006877155 /DNA_START=383 /DNA_END=1047 /DNA_ORIENTATION=+
MSGAIDIVVVRQQDGTFRSSPFYVRFGKYRGLFTRKERTVTLSVDGVQVDLTMRLSHSGEAYFTDPTAAEEGPLSPSKKSGTDEEVFSDPVGISGYSSGEGESLGDAEGGRQRWYQRNFLTSWRKSPIPSKSALSEQLKGVELNNVACTSAPPTAEPAVADMEAPSGQAEVSARSKEDTTWQGSVPPVPYTLSSSHEEAEAGGYFTDADGTPKAAADLLKQR